LPWQIFISHQEYTYKYILGGLFLSVISRKKGASLKSTIIAGLGWLLWVLGRVGAWFFLSAFIPFVYCLKRLVGWAETLLTTNGIASFFGHLKDNLSIHRGLTLQHLN